MRTTYHTIGLLLLAAALLAAATVARAADERVYVVLNPDYKQICLASSGDITTPWKDLNATCRWPRSELETVRALAQRNTGAHVALVVADVEPQPALRWLEFEPLP